MFNNHLRQESITIPEAYEPVAEYFRKHVQYLRTHQMPTIHYDSKHRVYEMAYKLHKVNYLVYKLKEGLPDSYRAELEEELISNFGIGNFVILCETFFGSWNSGDAYVAMNPDNQDQTMFTLKYYDIVDWATK